MKKSNDKINVDIWYSSLYELQDSRIDFSHLATMQDIFKDKVVFQPRTFIYGCLWCDQKTLEEKCIFDGKYCPYYPDDVDPTRVRPRDLIDQSLREQCVYQAISNTTKAHWFIYISQVMNICSP